MLGSEGMRTPSLNQLYLDGGEPTGSWQVSVTARPVVTELGTLTTGSPGGTAGQDITFSACEAPHSLHSIHTVNILGLGRLQMGETCWFVTKVSLPRMVIVTLTSPNWLFADTSQEYTPVSSRVTLENLRLLPYIVTRSAYGAVEERHH